MGKLVSQDPDERLDYVVDWAAPRSSDNPKGPWLVEGDTITTSTFAVTPEGLTEDGTDSDATTATVWLTGGTAGARYTVTNHIITAAGREGEWSFDVQIRDS